MRISCEIVEDLLPLYLDGVCSEQSRSAVNEHICHCDKCKKLAGIAQKVTVPEIEPDSLATDRAVKKGLKKIHRRLWACVLTVVALIPLLFLGWNEFSAQGVAYSNLDELLLSDRFMQCLVDGNYEEAYGYINIADKKQTWLENWFEEEDLTNMEKDGLAKFCELGEKVEQQLGRIESYEYVGTVASSGTARDGGAVDQVTYRIRIGGKEQIFLVNISGNKVEWFDGGGSFLTDPLAQFCMWSEYLWQDYAGCYYDAELKTYVYYDENNMAQSKINP